MKVTSEICVKGIPICRGIAIGKPFFYTRLNDEIPEITLGDAEIENEIKRYYEAISKSKKDLKKLQKKLKKERIAEGAAILDAFLEIMQDPLLTTHVEEKIRETHKNAEFVFQYSISQFEKKFRSLTDPLFREKFNDIQDLSGRVMGYLRESVRTSLAEIPPDSIVFFKELTASDTAEANANGFVTSSGGPTSHAAIVAKAKGIPYVTNVNFDHLLDQAPATRVIVDGRTGDIIFAPSNETLKKYKKLQNNLFGQFRALVKDRKFSPKTLDGYEIKLSANIDRVEEIKAFHKHGGSGVGLFRSEYISIYKDSFPSEEEQYRIYRRLIKQMKGLPIVIRTFDFEGDKLALNQSRKFDRNFFLGSGAIRFLLKEKEIFKAQIRAILRASEFGKVSIMFPMISSLPELIQAKEMVQEAAQELLKRKVPFAEKVSVGCMIEVPSAAIIADLLAKECDFLSIGTNDLVQYSLAVDRRNHSFGSLYAPTDPSVLRMIKHVVDEAGRQKIPVAICGEIAADPRFAPLLIGLGIKELSVSPLYIPVIKRVVRRITRARATELAKLALSYTNSKDILELISQEYAKTIPDDPFYMHNE